ncbi:MAG: NAD(P)-binding protein [Thermoplasmatales archaeon]
MKYFDTAILGAGWAGLLCAKRSNKITKRLVIIEKLPRKELGGLLKSEIINGLTFDTGGPHLLFSKDERLLHDVVSILSGNVRKLKRNNFVLYDGKYIPYPFENGIYKLKPEKRVKIANGIIEKMLYVTKNPTLVPNTFLEWILDFFGDEMANEYLIPYNKKIWKRPLDSMAADWIFTPGRLPFPQLEDVLKSAAGIPTIGYKEQSFFYYPKIGGIQALYNSLLKEVELNGAELIDNENISKIDHEEDTFVINGKISAKNVINTAPLPEIITAIDNSKESMSIANQFDYNSVITVGVVVKRNHGKQLAVYVPDPKVIFHRYSWMSYLSPPKDKKFSNLIAEVTVPKGVQVNIKNIEMKVLKDLVSIGAIPDERDIILSKGWYNKYGYPIYILNHNSIRDKAMSLLKNYNIKTVGRWGSWHYWNTDMVMKAVNENV